MIIFKKIGEYCWRYMQGATVEQIGMAVSGIALAMLVLAIL